MTAHSPDHAERAAIVAAGLTKAQKAFLMEESHHFASGYKPGEKLVSLGLLNRKQSTFGQVVRITEAGLAVRAALNDEGKGK